MPNGIRTVVVFHFLIIMIRFLTLCLLLLASINLNAQSLSAGLRANAAYRMRMADDFSLKLETMYGDHLSLTPEAFVRYTTKKRWAFEASINRSAYRPPDVKAKFYEQGQAYDTAALKYKADYLDVTVSALYELKCPKFQNSAFLKRLRSYVGVSLGVVFNNYESADFLPGHYGWLGWVPAQYIQWEGQEKSIWTGVSHSMSYDLGKKVKLVSSAYFKCRPGLLLSTIRAAYDYDQAAQFGVQLGAAYSIF